MNIKKVILFMGLPGSGKGTQAKLLSEYLGYPFFGIGALAREYTKIDDEFGRKIKNIIDQGIILPIDIVKEIFEKKINSLSNEKGLILDAYPRTLDQVELLESLIKKYKIFEHLAIFIDVDKDHIIERIKKRGEGRKDDDPEVIKTRFEEYNKKTADVKKYYEDKGLLLLINGDQPIDKVHADIKKELGV